MDGKLYIKMNDGPKDIQGENKMKATTMNKKNQVVKKENENKNKIVNGA